jgi:D-amino-acid dehydrogenase
VAGTLELVDSDESITKRRVNAILKGAHDYLYVPKEPSVRELWRGLRPCTPDGVPMIGYSKKWKNLFYCTGHQMLGLQSAPGSARLAKELIQNETPYVNPKPFLPDRF